MWSILLLSLVTPSNSLPTNYKILTICLCVSFSLIHVLLIQQPSPLEAGAPPTWL